MNRVIVVIPTYNEAPNLPLLVPRGLEQGFTLESRPDADAGSEGPLWVELALGGAEAKVRGDGLELRTATGRRLRYSGL